MFKIAHGLTLNVLIKMFRVTDALKPYNRRESYTSFHMPLYQTRIFEKVSVIVGVNNGEAYKAK